MPHGSEHYSYTQQRKNNYEEALFKVEDERFEFDININLYKRGLSIMNKIISQEKITKEDQSCLFKKIIDMKILQCLYGNR